MLALVILAIVFIKIKTAKHNYSSIFMIVLVAMFAISLLYVYVSHGANLSSFDGLVGFGKAYFSWAGGVFHNVARVTGYAVKQDWGVNSTIGK